MSVRLLGEKGFLRCIAPIYGSAKGEIMNDTIVRNDDPQVTEDFILNSMLYAKSVMRRKFPSRIIPGAMLEFGKVTVVKASDTIHITYENTNGVKTRLFRKTWEMRAIFKKWGELEDRKQFC